MDFIQGLLAHMNPYPAKNSLIIMDNARIHQDPRILEMIEQRGCRLLYLPPYSPDYNPIELAFSKIKSHVRRDGGVARADLGLDDTDVFTYLYGAAFSVSSEDAVGWFHHCGYL